MSSTPAHADVDDRGTASDTYRCEKNALRDIGCSLAAARDGGYRDTLEELLEVYKSTLNVKGVCQFAAKFIPVLQSSATDRGYPAVAIPLLVQVSYTLF